MLPLTDRTRSFFILCATTVLTLVNVASAADDRLAPEDFAILPWGWTPGDEEVLRDIYKCGFNLAGFVAPEGVDAVQKAGLKCIVSDRRITSGVNLREDDPDEIRRTVKAATDPLRDHPAVYGWYLRDEPDAPYYDVLAKWCDALREAVPDHRRYINLFPIYVDMPRAGADSYEQYVELFVDKCKPQFISYDNYSLMDDGSLRDGYYRNLEVMRDASLRHDIPFWNIVLSNSHFRYAEPTDATLRFQLYTTLAYGARGISYFTYFTPQTGNYRLGPIDQFGHKTATWDALRRVNLQIHKLGPVYITLRSVNVFHHPDVPEGSRRIDTSRHIAEVAGGDLLVGEFDDPDGRPYAMVVNKSRTTSCAYSVKFKNGGEILMVNAYTGATHAWRGEQNWLAPGQGMLLTAKPAAKAAP
jgi:hypothetical protein